MNHRTTFWPNSLRALDVFEGNIKFARDRNKTNISYLEFIFWHVDLRCSSYSNVCLLVSPPLRSRPKYLNDNKIGLIAILYRHSRSPADESFLLRFPFFFIEISTIIGWIVIKLATCIYCPQIINADDFSDPLTSPLAPPEGWHLCFWLKRVPDELNSAFILEILCRKFQSPPLLRREEGGAAFIWVLSHLALILQVCVFVCAHCMTGHLHSCLFCGQHM